MPLPKINAPIFELILPSTGKPVKYRPFLVKEQKILMIALEGEDNKDMTTAMKQVINNCAVDDVDVEKMPTFDLEYFFTRLRAKSIGENVELIMRHEGAKNKSGQECDGETKVNVNLMDIEVIKSEDHTDKIILDDVTGIGIKMRYPTMNSFDTSEAKTDLDLAAISILNSIDYIFDKEEIYKKEDQTKEELSEFIDSLSQDQFEKLAKFFETMPKLKHTIKWTCSKCGEKDSIDLEGMSNFFAF